VYISLLKYLLEKVAIIDTMSFEAAVPSVLLGFNHDARNKIKSNLMTTYDLKPTGESLPNRYNAL